MKVSGEFWVRINPVPLEALTAEALLWFCLDTLSSPVSLLFEQAGKTRMSKTIVKIVILCFMGVL